MGGVAYPWEKHVPSDPAKVVALSVVLRKDRRDLLEERFRVVIQPERRDDLAKAGECVCLYE